MHRSRRLFYWMQHVHLVAVVCGKETQSRSLMVGLKGTIGVVDHLIPGLC
jgi:hypothetical protein